MSESELETIRQRWTRRLSSLRSRLRLHQAAEAIALLLAGTVLALLVTGLIDYRFELSTLIRRFVLFVCGSVLAYSAWNRLLRPLLAKLDLIDVAAIIDRAISLRSSSDAAEPPDKSRPGHRPGRLTASVARVLDATNDHSPLLQKAIAQSDQTLSTFRMEQALDGRHLGKSIAGTVATLIIPAVIAFAVPTATKVWAARWIGGDDITYPRNTSLEVVGLKDNQLQVPRGEPYRVAVKVSDKADPTEVVWLRLHPDGGDRITSTLDSYGAADSEGTSPTSDFRGELPPLASLTPASVWGGDARPLHFNINPVDRPQIVSLDLVAKHPAEDEPRTFDMTTASDVRILRDSVAKLTVTTTGPVEPHFDTAAAINVDQVDPSTFEVSWTQKEPTAIRVALTSTESGLESFPRTVPIGLLPDRAPSVTLRHSGVRLRVTPIATIPLAVTARDDFGVAAVTLNGDITRLKLTIPEEAEAPESDADSVAPSGSAETADASPDGPTEQATPPSPSNDTDDTSNNDSDTEITDAETPVEANVDDNAAGSKTPPPTGTGPISLYKSDEASELRIDREHRLELASLMLKPGDVVKVTATATDAAYGGAQERKSRTITFRVVKDEDLFREIKLRLQQLRARLRKATDASDEFRLEIAKSELPKAASALGRKYQVSRREIGTISNQIAQAAIEVDLNKLGGSESEEVSEQLQRTVVQPLERLLAGAMDRQRITLGDLAKASGQQIETNRQEAVTRQEEIVASLNEVLKNMNQWDSFVDVVNQLNAVISLEQDVRTRTNALSTGDPATGSSAAKEPEKPEKPKTNAADDIFDN